MKTPGNYKLMAYTKTQWVPFTNADTHLKDQPPSCTRSEDPVSTLEYLPKEYHDLVSQVKLLQEANEKTSERINQIISNQNDLMTCLTQILKFINT